MSHQLFHQSHARGKLGGESLSWVEGSVFVAGTSTIRPLEMFDVEMIKRAIPKKGRKRGLLWLREEMYALHDQILVSFLFQVVTLIFPGLP